MKWSRTVTGIVIVSLSVLSFFVMTGCASVVHDPAYDGDDVTKLVTRCSDACFILMAQNNNFYDARTYINGQRITLLPGMMPKALPIVISRGMLDGAGCLQVFVQLFPDNKSGYSDRECPAQGSRLSLTIEESYGGHPLHVWLVPWAK